MLKRILIVLLFSSCSPSQIVSPIPGPKGDSCVLNSDRKLIQCVDGSSVVVPKDGVSPTFSIVPAATNVCAHGGFTITLVDSAHSETVSVCNGNQGSNGSAGTDGSNGGTVSLNLVQVIQACGSQSSPYKETLLGLQGGQILGSFSETTGGQNTRLIFLQNGTFQNTDSSGCQFTISGIGTNNVNITWPAGSNGYATWNSGGYTWDDSFGWMSL